MKKLFLIFLFLKLTDFASASHLMGGNLGYEYLGPSGGNFQYKIRLILYYNCDANSVIPNPEANQNISIYLQDIPNNPMGGGNKTLHTTMNLSLVLAEPVEPPIASGCGIGQDVCINKGVYEGFIILPMNFNGYHLYFENFARNAAIVNLLNPGGTAMAFHAYIPPTLVNNSTPVFFDDPVPFLCLNDTTSILNTAFDPDGDQLIFSFVNPYTGSGAGSPLLWPITPVTYNAGFSLAQPFGAAGYSFINGSNGLTSYMSTLTGNFVVCVEIREYRNGNLIGVSRRDLQLLVINCPPNDEPVLTSNNGNVQFTVQECSQLCFPITFNDPDLDSISLQVSSQLDDNSQFNPVAVFDTLVNTTSPATSNFCWTPGCGTAQTLPYLVIASATDNGCPPKTDNIIYEITVTPPTAPTSISGPNPVCANTTTTYSTNFISGYTYDWNITNGNIISGQGTNTITVEFPMAGSATLSVNSLNSCGCPSADISLNITVLSAPAVNAGPDLNICIGDTITIGGAPTGPGGSIFSWTPSSTLTSSSISNPGAFPTVNTSYIITVDNGSSCTNTDTVNVNVLSPSVDAGSDVSICTNDTTQLNASGAISYNWTPTIGLSNPAISNPLAFPLATTDYIVTGIGVNGCSISDTITITVNPIPVITIAGDTEICLNDSTQLTASGGTIYFWSPGVTLSNPNISNPFASPVSTTTYSVIVSNAGGCSDTAQVTVTVNTLPVVIADGDTSMCFGECKQLSATGANTYSWSPATGLNNPSLSNPMACPTVTTLYTVTGTDANGCTDTSDVNIIIFPLPNANAGTDVSICINDTAQLNASGGTIYNWSPPTGLNSVVIANPLAFPITTTTYTVSVTDINGCVDDDEVIVTVNPQPIVTISNDATICNQDTIQLNATGGTSYSWSPSLGLNATNVSNPLAFPNATTTYTVIIADINGCSDTVDVTITVNALPNVIAGNDTTMCIGECSQMNAVGALSFVWLPSTGLNNPSQANPIACPIIPTDYIVTGTDVNGCENSDTVNIIVNPLPIIDAGNDTSLCLNDTIQLNATGGISYSWSPSLGLSATNVSNPLIFPLVTTTYIVTATDVNGCENSDTIIVTVNPLPIADAGIDLSICINDTIQIDGSGGLIYSWTPITGLDNASVENPLAFPIVTTNYILQVTDINSCTDKDTMILTVNPLPVVVASNDTSVCLNDCAQLNANGAVSYSWIPIIGLNNPSIANPLACPTVNTTYQVTGTDANGCENSDTVNIIVNPLPIIDAGNDTSLCLNDTIQLNATGGISYSWSPALGLNATTISNPLAFPLVTTTYIVTATDMNGCENSDTIIVTVNPLPIADAGIDLSICINDTIQIDGSGGLIYSWAPITGLDDSSAENPLAFPIVTTNYILQVTDINSCTDKDTMILIVNPLPVVVASNDTSVCLNDCAQLNATGAVNYSWLPILGLNNPSIANPLACPTVNTTYQVTGTDVNGCINSDLVTINIFSLPIADAGIDLWLCPGDDIQLSGSGGIIFNWTPVADLNNPNISNPDANPTDTTEYILVVTDVNGCQDSDSMFVFVNDGVPVDAGADRTICEGDSSRLGGTSSSPLGTIFLWTPSGTLDDPTSANPIAFPIVTTTYIVFVANDTCTNADTVTVFVNPTPLADAGSDLQMCLNDSVQLQATGGVQYVWTPATSLSNDSISDPFAFPILSTEYFVTVTDINGCVGYDSTNVTVFNLPMVDAGNDTAICIGDTAQLNGNSGFTSYVWTPGNTLDDSTIINPLAFPTQTTDYILSVVDLNTCSNSDTVSVVVNLLPIVDAGNDTSLCIGGSIGLNATGGIIYIWTPGSTLSDSLISSPSAFPSSTEMYHVNVTDVNGCKNSDSVLVVVNLLPIVDAGNDTAICIGDQAQLNVTSGFVQYDWNNGSSLDDSTIFNPMANPILTTEYFVMVTDNNGCMNFDSVTVTVHQLPNINAGANINICRRDTVQLSASGGVSYIWTPNISINDTSIQSPLVWPEMNTVYHVTGTDVFGCVNSDSILVNVFRVTGSPDTTICNGSSVQLFVNGPNAITWNWTPVTGLNNSTIFNPIASPASSVSYVIAVLDNAGCRDTFAIDVDVVDPPIADFVYTVVPTCEGLLATFENLSSGAQNYLWNFGDGTTDTTQNPTHVFIYNNTLTTTLITTNSFGCTDTITSSQPVLDFTNYYQITIPNVFTPNGDGVNDVYEIPMNGLFEDCMKFSVYNRWGKILYESDGVTISWDGRYNGEKISNGVYYYILSINGIDFKGNMTILE